MYSSSEKLLSKKKSSADILRGKLAARAEGPFRVVGVDDNTTILMCAGLKDRVSKDRAEKAPLAKDGGASRGLLDLVLQTSEQLGERQLEPKKRSSYSSQLQSSTLKPDSYRDDVSTPVGNPLPRGTVTHPMARRHER